MKRLLPLLLAPALFALPQASAADDPPVNAAEILQMLEALRDKAAENRQSARDKVIKDFQTAAASGPAAVAFYEQAVMATRFSGQSRENTQLRDWKEKEATRLKSKGFQAALRAHLQYLALSLKAGAGGKPEDLLAPLLEYANFIWNSSADDDFANELNGRDGLLRRPVRESLFVQWYQAAPFLPGDQRWEPVPGNLDGIFDKAVLPPLREAKDPRVITYWDQRIAREEERSRESRRAFDAERFAKIVKPSLLWKRAQEYPHLDQRNRAIREMVAIIKANPDHPEFDRWIETLLGLLKSGAAPSAPPPQAPPAPAPGDAPPPASE